MAKIWIINQYCPPPRKELSGRHQHFATLLAERGHDVCLIGARSHHLMSSKMDAQSEPPIERVRGYRYVRIDVPPYDKAHDKRRVLAWFSFAWRIRNLEKLIQEKPDVILVSSLSLVSYLGAEWLARKCKARLVFEVRDIWPLTITAKKPLMKLHPFFILLKWIEKRAYRKADHVISTLSNAFEYMRRHGVPKERYTWITNGWMPEEKPVQVHDALREFIPTGKYIIGYTGSFPSSNSIDAVIEAAKILRKDLRFVFVLIGNYTQNMPAVKEVEKRGLTNILFHPNVSESGVSYALTRFDACITCREEHPVYEYGTSSIKMGRYIWSGKPIIQAYSGKGDPVAEYDLGITVQASDYAGLADAIVEIASLSVEQKNQMKARAIEVATTEFNYKVLSQRLEKILLNLPNNPTEN